MFIIGVTGLPGSGKDFVADMLVDKHGFYKIAPGDIIRRILKEELGDSFSRSDQQKWQAEKRSVYGESYVMQLCYDEMLKSGKSKIVLAGTRPPSDLEFYRKLVGGNFKNVYVDAPAGTRYSRLMDRKRMDAPKSFEEFLKEDENEEKLFSIKKTKELSDFILLNDSSAEALEKKLDDILTHIKIS